MSNVQYAKSLDAYLRADNITGNAFADLVHYVVAHALADVRAEDQAEVLGNMLKKQEGEYKAEKKLDSMPTAYRSAKSVIVKAVTLGVSLVDAKGKARGKSELESECKEKAGDSKPEIQKFTSTMATAMSIFAKLDTLHDVDVAYKLVEELANAVVKARAEMISKAAETK